MGISDKDKRKDFRWTPNGYVSVIYSKSDIDFKGTHCIRVAQFSVFFISL